MENNDHQDPPDIETLRTKAKRGHADALFELGRCYYNGEGVEPNTEKAVACWKQAAEQGSQEATDAIDAMKNDGTVADAAKEMFRNLSEEAQEVFRYMCDKAECAEDLIAFSMVGPCPRCGNELTKDGDSAAPEGEVGDTTVGVCPECDYRWCVECGQELTQWPCPHWGAWEAYCKEQQIYQGKEAFMEEGYNETYLNWLEDYIEEQSTKEKSDDSGSQPPEMHCCHCGKVLESGPPALALMGKFRNGVETPPVKKEPHIHGFRLPESMDSGRMRTVYGIIMGGDSDVKKEGFDFIFPLCSEKCARKFSEIIKAEKDFADVFEIS